jgi:hypothetical protein
MIGLLKKRKKAKKSHLLESGLTKPNVKAASTTVVSSNATDKVIESVVSAPIAVAAAEIGA